MNGSVSSDLQTVSEPPAGLGASLMPPGLGCVSDRFGQERHRLRNWTAVALLHKKPSRGQFPRKPIYVTLLKVAPLLCHWYLRHHGFLSLYLGEGGGGGSFPQAQGSWPSTVWAGRLPRGLSYTPRMTTNHGPTHCACP